MRYDPNKIIEYKYVVFNAEEKKLKWEEGENRNFKFSDIKNKKQNDIFISKILEILIISL